jgi:hypothetical protein
MLDALNARLFTIKTNLKFGKEYLDIYESYQLLNENNDEIKQVCSQFRDLIEQQKLYENQINKVIESKPNQILKKTFELLMNDERNNSILKKINEIKETNREEESPFGLNYDIDAYDKQVQKLKDKFKVEKLNIIVIGKRGSGKSSFINTFFNVDNFNEKAVKTDVVECSIEPENYKYEDFHNDTELSFRQIQIWDYPGAGTDRFPINEYIQVIKHLPADAFIHLYHKRFTETDKEILDVLKNENKRFFLVRSYADVHFTDIENKENLAEKWNEFKLKAMKDTSVSDFLKESFEKNNLKFYFLSCQNEHRDIFDFPLLITDLLLKLPDEKISCLLISLQLKSEIFFKKKLEILDIIIDKWIRDFLNLKKRNSNSEILFKYLISKLKIIHLTFGINFINDAIIQTLHSFCQKHSIFIPTNNTIDINDYQETVDLYGNLVIIFIDKIIEILGNQSNDPVDDLTMAEHLKTIFRKSSDECLTQALEHLKTETTDL